MSPTQVASGLNPTAVQIRQALDSDEFNVREQATTQLIQTISRQGGMSVSLLLPLLTDSSAEVRSRTVYALTQISPQEQTRFFQQFSAHLATVAENDRRGVVGSRAQLNGIATAFVALCSSDRQDSPGAVRLATGAREQLLQFLQRETGSAYLVSLLGSAQQTDFTRGVSLLHALRDDSKELMVMATALGQRQGQSFELAAGAFRRYMDMEAAGLHEGLRLAPNDDERERIFDEIERRSRNLFAAFEQTPQLRMDIRQFFVRQGDQMQRNGPIPPAGNGPVGR